LPFHRPAAHEGPGSEDQFHRRNAPYALATRWFENDNPGKLAARPTHSFATKDGAHALWVRIDPNPDLTALHSAIASTLSAAIDHQPENRPYRPHITVARLGLLPADTAVQFVTKNAAFHFAPFPVTEFAQSRDIGLLTEIRHHVAIQRNRH